MKFRSVLAASVALACLSTVALASGVQFRGTGTIGDVAQDAERITLQFAPRTNVLLGGTVVSDVVRYDGPTLNASVSGGEMRLCATSACGTPSSWVPSGPIAAGQFVQLRRAGPQAAGATVTAALEIAGQRFAFDATARSQAPAFDAIAAATAEPGEAKDGGLSTFHGWVEAPISVTGGEYRICSTQGSCGSFTTANGTVRDGDQVQIRVVAGAFGESRTASVAAGGASASFAVDVRTKDVTPDAFAPFDAQTSQNAPGFVWVTTPRLLKGHDGIDVSVSGQTAEYRLCASADCSDKGTSGWTTAVGQATNGQYVQMRLTTAAFGETRSATLVTGTVSSTLSIATRVKDVVPDSVTFASLTDQIAGATVVSAIRQLTGHDGVSVGVTGVGGQVRACSAVDCVGASAGAWGTSAEIPSGGYVQLRTIASNSPGETISITLNYGTTQPAVWSVGTAASTVPTGPAYAWGYNAYGQLGTGNKNNSSTPVAVTLPAGVTAFSSLAATQSSACAIGSDANAYCWGDGGVGQIGNGLGAQSSIPAKVTKPNGLAGFKSIVVGYEFACAVGSDDATYCWGNNSNYQLGDGTSNTSYVPVKMKTTNVEGVLVKQKSSGSHSCSLSSGGKLYCWGYNGYGQIGNGSTTDARGPTEVVPPSGTTGFKDLAVSFNTTCAVASDDATYCWGYGSQGQLGNSTSDYNATRPTKVTLPSGVTSLKGIVGGFDSFCAIGSDGFSYCWGVNNIGQLGNGTSNAKNVPTKVSNATGNIKVAVDSLGWTFACGLGTDGERYCWGSNQRGQFGDGTTTSSLIPVKVPRPAGLSKIIGFALGNMSSYAIGQ